MNTTQRGFVPLVVIVLLGIVAVAGGTVAVMSHQESNPNDSKEVLIQEQEEQVSEQIEEDSSVTTDMEVNQRLEGILEEPGHQLGQVVQDLVIDEEVVSICKEAKDVVIETDVDDNLSEEPKRLQEGAIAARESLIGEIQELCVDLTLGDEKSEQIERGIREKWNLWERVSFHDDQVKRELQRQQDDGAHEENTDIQQAKEEGERYERSDIYPIILSFEDNHGNIYKRTNYNGYEGSYGHVETKELKVGDVIRATVIAEDPKGRQLEYNWHSNSQPFNETIGILDGGYYYTSDNTVEYRLTEEDLRSTGENFRLVYQVRVADTDFYRGGSGNQVDDTGFIDYRLVR
jgi:hypothetical protein